MRLIESVSHFQERFGEEVNEVASKKNLLKGILDKTRE